MPNLASQDAHRRLPPPPRDVSMASTFPHVREISLMKHGAGIRTLRSSSLPSSPSFLSSSSASCQDLQFSLYMAALQWSSSLSSVEAGRVQEADWSFQSILETGRFRTSPPSTKLLSSSSSSSSSSPFSSSTFSSSSPCFQRDSSSTSNLKYSHRLKKAGLLLSSLLGPEASWKPHSNPLKEDLPGSFGNLSSRRAFQNEFLQLAFLWDKGAKNCHVAAGKCDVTGALVEPPSTKTGKSTENDNFFENDKNSSAWGIQNSVERGVSGASALSIDFLSHRLKVGEKGPSNPPFSVSSGGNRVLAIGDLHGDWDKAVAALQLAGVLSNDGQMRWVGRASMGGRASILVQVGDVLDRGGDEIAIMSLIRHLQIEAARHNGAVYQVNGNHETMNVEGDYRFVTDDAYVECEQFVRFCTDSHGGDWESAFIHWWKEARELRNSRRRPSALGWRWNPIQTHKSQRARTMLFQPGGPLALQLSRCGVVLQVDDSLFCHGGVLPHHVQYGLNRLNMEVSRWMRGETNTKGEPTQMPYMATKGYDSVVWSRLYSHRRYESDTDRRTAYAALVSALDLAGVQRQVVGHTPQDAGANSDFGGRVWRIDVGMSSGIMDAPPQVLEILGSTVRVLGNAQMESVMDYV